MEDIKTTCCIVGGGPAGMMLAFLLARAGVETVLLEKHADFLRDFRGDTVHPSTLELLFELGMLDDFLRRPHSELSRVAVQIGDTRLWAADFSRLRTHARFIAFVPQWDFLNFLAERAQRYPEFQLHMQTEAVDLIENGGRVTGVRAKSPEGDLTVWADLVVGTDGRHSTVRERAGFTVEDKGAPMDVLWLRLTRQASDPAQSLGRVDRGRILVMLDRGEYWQCAYVIPKGSAEALKAFGIQNLRDEIARLVPYLGDRVAEIKDWDDVKLLTVKVDRLKQWHKPGLLCIGDAAHAMSPIGGVGINLAVQDAVAAANILAEPLAAGRPLAPFLDQVQRRREFPARITQWFQILAQNRVISRVLASEKPIQPPFILRLMQRWPLLQGIPARAIGLGARPEHVRTRDAHEQRGGVAA
jgi:2-polyprenyl-6-methoxyphenol hydroxylase-like FAD-dependent oxidoreductase